NSMGAGMKRARDKEVLSLALALTTDSPTPSTTSADSAGSPAKKSRRRARGAVVATSGEGEFVCKTCGRAFVSFRALGGHRTSHLRGRHELELGVGIARAIRERRRRENKAQRSIKQRKKQRHECHICGLGFEMGQALGGHMRRHREDMALGGADDQRVALLSDQEVAGHQAAADQPPVLLELFV
uniref:C2H2-type domain-containing protein n=1 Tax=Aegilops tauschii subsp. strangulata TaxID=200361 RepID=A0A453M9R4_AEGTS